MRFTVLFDEPLPEPELFSFYIGHEMIGETTLKKIEGRCAEFEIEVLEGGDPQAITEECNTFFDGFEPVEMTY